MSIKDNIYAFLKLQQPIMALVDAESIGWVDVDLGTDYPKIVYHCVSAPPLYNATDQWERWRFFIFSREKVQCEQIKEALTTALHGLMDFMGNKRISYVNKIDENPIFRGDDNIYEMSIDFRFSYF